jgi:Fe-S-cluster containining protein
MEKEKPNLSDRIRSSDCIGCGICCEKFEIWYPPADGSIRTDIMRSEIDRFKMLSGIGDLITTRSEADGSIWLVFNLPCRYLQADKTCAIYHSTERPLLCRYFPYATSTKDDCPQLRSETHEQP